VRRCDWLAAVAMSAGIGLFLGLAAPSGGRPHAPASTGPRLAGQPDTRRTPHRERARR